MALFGVQLVITTVIICFLQKLSPHFSVARWILCSKLVRYVHPTNEELKELVGVHNQQQSQNHKKNKGGRERRSANGYTPQTKKDEPFKVPRNIDIQLESAKVHPIDLVQLNFYPEYQWLFDFSISAVIVYTTTEIYLHLVPIKDEFNLSLMWCLLVIGLAIKVLYSMTALYFKGEETGERSMCITCGFFFFVLAMVILVIDENLLEFGLDKAYSSLNESVTGFLQSQGLNSRNPASLIGFKLILAIWCGLIGAFFTFPGLRFARMHCDCLKYCGGSALWKTIFNVSFIAPFLLLLLWVKPIARDYFTVRKFPGMESTLMTPEAFETSRLLAVLIVVCLRLVLMPKYLQSYLNMAHVRVDDLKKEVGQISSLELQKMVARVFYYLCVVALQYIAPLLICFFFTFLLKTLGGYSWTSYFGTSVGNSSSPFTTPPLTSTLNETDSILAASQHFSLAFANIRKVFTPTLYRGVLNFVTWWLCTTWFATSTIGLVYHSYFAAQ